MSILKRPGWANHEIVNEGRLHNDKLKDKIGKMFDRLSLGYSPNHVVDKIASIIKSEKGDKFDISKISNEYIIDIANSDFVTRGKFSPALRPSFASEYQNTNNTSDISIPSPKPVSTEFSTIATPTSVETNSLPIGVIPSEDSEESNNLEDSEDSEEKEMEEDAEDPKRFETRRTPETRVHRMSPQNRRNRIVRDTKEEDFLSDNEDEKHDEPSEDAEEAKTCVCQKHDAVTNPEITKKSFDKAAHPKSLTIKTSETHRESAKLSPKAVNQLLKENYIKQKQHLSRIEERYGIR